MNERLSAFPLLLRLFSVLFASLLLCGCKIPLYTELSEQEANEILSVMVQSGIPCSKQAGAEGKWILQVEQSKFPLAMERLAQLGLPKDRFQKMGQIFNKSGLVSSPTEERVRFMYALSQELSETLMDVDGVISARVHIVLPENDPLDDKILPASAAVYIKYRPGFQVESAAPDLKNLVSRSIEGLSYENVTLIMMPAQDPPPITPPISTTTSSTFSWFDLNWLLLGMAAVGGGLLGGLGCFYFLSKKRRKENAPA